jgi:ribonuclease/clavin/mitogillin
MTTTRVSIPIETRAPTGETGACVLGSDPALLVDPAASTDRLDAVAARNGVGHVAVTHHHPDHVGAVARYAERHDATVWARTGREDAFEAAAGIAADRTFHEGTTIPTGGDPVCVLDTPGHAPEHVAFAHGSTVAGGDLAVAGGSVAVAAPEGDLRAYLTSLRRIHALGPGRLLPGHGPVIDDVRPTVERLVAHRLDRERRVLAAVEGGARTVAAVCDGAYGKDLTGVRDLAEATVRAHLEKLAVEGKLRWDPHRGEARPA